MTQSSCHSLEALSRIYRNRGPWSRKHETDLLMKLKLTWLKTPKNNKIFRSLAARVRIKSC